MDIFKGWKKKRLWGIGALVLVLLFCIGLNQNWGVEAAEPVVIKIGGDAGTEEYEVRTTNSKITLMQGTTDISNLVKSITATTTEKGDGAVDKEIVTLSASGTMGTITDLMTVVAAGEGIVEVTYTENGVDKVVARKIIVPYAFNENADIFGKIYESDEDNVMILEYGATDKVSFLFPVAGMTWTSGNDQVITINSTTGEFQAVGTGKTQITASYNLNNKTETTSVDVYVGPCITDGVTSGNVITPNLNFGAHKGEKVYTGANNEGTVKYLLSDKVEWVTSKIVGTDLVAMSEEIFEHGPYDTNLTVTGRAGNYSILFHTAGIDPNSNELGAYVTSRLMQTLQLKIYAECKDISNVSLQVGDMYDLAKVFNVSEADFKKYFIIGTEDDVCGKADDGYSIIGKEEGETTITVTRNVNESGIVTDLPMENVTEADAYASFSVNVTVYKGFSLSITKTVLSIGETKTLETVFAGNQGTVTWKTNNPAVTLKPSGNFCDVTGATATPDYDVVVTATMTLPDGRKMSATCVIKVTDTVQTITLDPLEKTIDIKDSVTINAIFTPSDISTASLSWAVTNKEVADIKVSPDGKSAVITGKKAGETLVTVVNKDNAVVTYAKIKVAAPIEKIWLNKTEMTVKKSYQTVKLIAEYTPKDATLTDLIWKSKNESVATVDEWGNVTLVGPGTTTIRVYPATNPNFVEAICDITVVTEPNSLTLSKNSLELEVGKKEKLEATYTPEGATLDITWDVVDSSVAKVSDDGTVTAVGVGQTYVIATAILEGGNVKIEKCLVTVIQNATGVTVEPATIRIAVGETYQLTAKANPEKSTDKKFIWKSLDEKIATVADGKVTGKSAGQTTILVTPEKGGTPATVIVNVYDKCTGMTLNHSEVTIAKGDTFTLKPIFTPSNVTNKNVKWTSTNEKVASISNGKIKGLKGGTTIITAISEDGGYMATCIVTVQERITSVKLNKSSVVVGVGKTYKLKATVESNSASNPKVKWTTSNKKIVKVSKNGNIRGVKVGTATITVKVTDGTNKKATCKVRVVRPATKVTLNTRVLNLPVGQTGKLKATIKPSNATYKTVNWKSADPTIAEVLDGEVLALSLGSTKVTATAKDNSGKKATCYVNVIEEIPASSIVLSAQNLTLVKGDSEKIGYSIVPHNNTDKVYFDSDNRAVATVNGSGKVYGKRAGVANITISTSSGKQAMIKVTVLGLNKTKITLEQYDSETLFIDGTTTGITWFTSNPNVATVQNGKVLARKAGTCTIYAKVNGISLSCKVVVKNIN